MPPLRDSAKDKELLREMSFLEHLDDLRGVLIQSLIVFTVAMIVCWFFSARVIDLLIADLAVDQLNFFAPSEAFMVRMKISAVLGLMIVFPFLLFKIWRFIAPAMFSTERSRFLPLIVSSSVLFYVGIAFCYLILIPVVLEFLLGFSTEHLNAVISVSSYFAMVARLCFSFGLVFQLPILILVLSLIGLVKPRFLLKQWRYAILIIFVVSALLTPPDPVSQVLMALPVVLLYIGSVLIAFIVVKRKNDSDEKSDDDGSQED